MRSKMKRFPPKTFQLIPFIVGILCLLFLLTGVFLPQIGALPEVYYDIVQETLAQSDGNRSHELKLLYGLMAFSLFLLVIAWQMPFFRGKEGSPSKDVILQLLFWVNVVYLVARGTVYPPLLYGLFLYGFAFYKERNARFYLFFLGVFLFYAATGILSLVYFLTPAPSVTLTHLIGISLAVFCVLYGYSMTQGGINTTFLANCVEKTQYCIPLSYLALVHSRYLYQGESILLWYHWKYLLVIFMVMIATYGCLIYEKKKKTARISILDSVYHTTIVTLFTLRSSVHDTYNLVISEDTHHTAESILAFPQVAQFGQELYTEIIPASGLFPLLVGAVNQFCNEGSYISAFSTHTLVTMGFCILTMALYVTVFGKTTGLVVGLLFKLTFYNRIYMILPVALVLMLPKLRNRVEYWLPMWVCSIFLAGLYYPIFGVGLLLGSLPYGIKQVRLWLQMWTQPHPKGYLLLWAALSALILWNVPLLWEMVCHTIRYSQQSVLADGIAVFGESLPSFYAPYLNHEGLRLFLNYGFKFSLPIAFVLIAVTLLAQHQPSSEPWGMALTMALTVPVVSFSFTLVREDVGMILARASHPIVLSCILLLGVLWKKQEVSPRTSGETMTAIALTIVCAVFFVPVVNLLPQSQREVPSHYQLYNEAHSSYRQNLGTGFASASYVDFCEYMDWQYSQLGQDYAVLTDMGQAVFLVNNWKTAGTGTTMIAKDYATQSRILEILPHDVAFHQVDSLTNYYIYYDFLVNRGYRQGNEMFYLSPTALEENPNLPQGEYDITTARFCDENLGNIPVAWGKSMESLWDIFLPVEDITFQEKDSSFFYWDSTTEFYGYQADFLYLRLESHEPAPEKGTGFTAYLQKSPVVEHSLTIAWSDGTQSGQFYSNYGTGELLIPLGASPSWLLAMPETLTIALTEGSYSVETAQLLKLNQER